MPLLSIVLNRGAKLTLATNTTTFLVVVVLIGAAVAGNAIGKGIYQLRYFSSPFGKRGAFLSISFFIVKRGMRMIN